jgi:methionyl aminopeptidase
MTGKNQLFRDVSGAAITSGITIKSPREIESMRQAGQVVAATIARLVEFVAPGVTTQECDTVAEREIRRRGALPAFKGYRGFPATICVSINEEIVHGIPGPRTVRAGDVVSLDGGAIANGFYADAAVTVGVGEATPKAADLIEVTREALERGIKAAQPGARIGDISAAVEQFVEARGYSVVREYVGHGIGRALHEEPQVPNYGAPGRGLLLRPGMVIAIEPMVNVGDWRTRLLEDQWTVVTADGSLSAHFEDTVAITEKGPEVLTRLKA